MNERKPSNGLNSALKSISGESRWCVWKNTDNPDNPMKPEKTPINPRTGGGAMSNQPSTWANFDTAYTAREKFGAEGFGFFMGGGYAGIDIDDCIDDNKNISDMAAKIIEKMNSYTETSPRGHGIHILCRVSEGFTLDGKQGVKKKGLELYCGGRYLTVTGHVLGAEKPIELRENELLEVYHEYFVIPRENDAKKQRVNVSQGRNDLRVAGDKSDNELWTRIFDSQNGAKIRALYNGDISAYDNDDSRADLALCCYLAYWTGHDAGRIDRMFRQSGLMRSKWDETRGTQTYGAMTIAKAMNDTPRYSPPVNVASTPKKTGGIDWKYDPSAYHPDDDYEDSGHDEESAQGIKPITPPENRVQNESPAQSESDNSGHDSGDSENETHTVLDYLRNSFLSDIDRAKLFSKRKTGYSNIDKYNSLLPGLYVIGAVTGVGKTTFCGQMADYLAGAGEHVLYFALEQTELELVSKGLARLMARKWIDKKGADALTKYQYGIDAMTAIDIRKGDNTTALQQAIESYQHIGGNLRIVECDFNTNTQKIIQTVYDFMKKYRVRPVVFVDYLQLVRNPNQRLSTKDAVDDNVRAFKKLSAECDLAVFLISSLNRQNYLSVVDFESFKETGSIEYTADVVYGMQLLVMNAGVFNTNQNLQIKRKFVNDAKDETPRKIEIIMLKNRYGRGYSRYFFDYYSAYDLFVPYERREGDKRTEKEFIADIYAEMSAKYQAFAMEHAEELDSGRGRGGKKKPKESK